MNIGRWIACISVSLTVAATGCGATQPETLPHFGQLLLYINTDAPLPVAAGETPGPDDPRPLFDRVRIEVYPPGERSPCVDCTHEFDVDRRIVGEGRASAGITTPPGVSGYVARVRLFRSAFVELGQPRTDATVDMTVALPPTTEEGILPVSVVLRTEDVARPMGSLEAPISPELGPASPGLVGSWPGAQRSPCAGEPAPGEVCIPGGAYWMGNPLMRAFHAPGDSVVLRLVVVSPFFLDATEVMVPAFRASGLHAEGDPMEYDLLNHRGPRILCTFTTAPANQETLPVNCISWTRARSYCEGLGGDLPTEAQYQYVASAFEGALYPWGDDPPACEDAVYARAAGVAPHYRCPGVWVSPPGSARRDRLALPGGVVVDLAGNLAEHVLDEWNLQSEACWGTGVFRDPLCEKSSADPNGAGQHTVMAGSFVDTAGLLSAAYRRPSFSFAKAKAEGPSGGKYAPLVANTGFRCARPAAP